MQTVTAARRRSMFRVTRLLLAGLILAACGSMVCWAQHASADDGSQPTPSPSQASPKSTAYCPYKFGGKTVFIKCSELTGSGGTAGTGGGKSSPPVVCPSVVVGGKPGEACNLTSPIARGQGGPLATAQQLLQEAYGKLTLPTLVPGTAPPRGKDGLVGLPEWFWVPAASWHSVAKTVTAGQVWATATATPVGLRFDPGGGLASVSCAGPGTAYDKNEPVEDQSTDCDYTYLQSSADQPGGVYHATLNVLWRITWSWSGGPGFVLENADAMPAPFTIKVVQAEALVTGSS